MLQTTNNGGPREEPTVSAERASLVHVSDQEPGIRRKGVGKGFTYLRPDGTRVEDAETLERIRGLAIPPAWRDVWISPEPDGHIQATGRDAKGRKQYRYHPRWAACRDEVKYSSLPAFAEALPRIRAQVDADLRRREMPFERVVACVVWLLDNTLIRVGNSTYAKENKSFGLTTLRDRHVEIEGSKLRFAFKGKSGKEWRLRLADRRIAKIVRQTQDIPGQHLFQYYDDDGARHPVRSQDVNDYIRAASGADFSSKHFRTWGGSILGAAVLANTPVPETKSATNRVLNKAIDQVAHRLGNTRTVCRNCYIHPAVIESWREGTLIEEMKEARRRMRRQAPGLEEDETLFWKWLQVRSAAKG